MRIRSSIKKMEAFKVDDFAITVFVLCDDILTALDFEDDHQAKMSSSEIIAFSILAAKDFAGNHKTARSYFQRLGYFPNMLSNSRLNRRIRNIPWKIWDMIFRFLAYIFRKENTSRIFAVDSFPVASCQKSRIDRRKLFPSPSYLGFSASKKKYFCGIKVHMIVSESGAPVEYQLRPASENDISVLWQMEIELPHFSTLYADGAYTSFELEELLLEDSHIKLLPKRGSHIKNRAHSKVLNREISSRRQVVETAFSSITRLLPRALQVRTESGFLLRVFSAILAYGIAFLA